MTRPDTLLAALLFTTLPLYAQDESPETLDPLTVRGTAEWAIPADIRHTIGFDVDPAHLPMASERFDAELILKQDQNSLREVMENSAGAVGALGNGVHDFFVVRGIDSLTGALVLYDGLPEPEATIYPTYNIEAVEVLRGSAAFRHGPGAMAGSANLVRKEPVFTDLTTLHLGLAKNSRYDARLDVNRVFGALAVRSNTGYHQRESHRDGIEAEWFGQTLSSVQQLGRGATLKLTGEYLAYDIVPDAGVPVLGDRVLTEDDSASFNVGGDYSEQTVWRFGTDLLMDVGDAQVRNRLWATRLEWDSAGTVLAGFPLLATSPPGPDSLVLARLQPRLEDEQQLIGNRTEWMQTFEGDSVSHDVLLGLELLRLTDEFTLDFVPASSLNLFTGAPSAPLVPPLPSNVGDVTIDRLGLYAFDQVRLDRLELFAGARVDWIDFEDDAQGTSRNDTAFSPMLGAHWVLAGPWSVFANAGQAYNLASTQVIGDRGEPEESTQYEAGLRFLEPDNPFAIQLTAFHLNRDQIAIPDSTGVTRQSGEQESQGVELELSAEVTEYLRTRIAGSIMQSELTTFSERLGPFVADYSGNDAPFAPEQAVTWYSEYQHTNGVGLGVTVRHLGDHFISADNRYEMDATTTVSASVFYEQPRYRLYVYLNNLTDEEVYTRGVGSFSVIPEDGFNAGAAIQLQL